MQEMKAFGNSRMQRHCPLSRIRRYTQKKISTIYNSNLSKRILLRKGKNGYFLQDKL